MVRILVIVVVTLSLIGFTVTAFAGPMDDLLLQSVRNKNISMVKTALDNGADINYVARGFDTALSIAILQSNVEMVQFLLKQGADPNVNYKNGQGIKNTHFILAISRGNQNIIQQLINAGVDINATSEYGQTPLMTSASNPPDVQLAKYLISKNVNVNVSRNDGITALMIVAKYENGWGSGYRLEKLAVAKMLLKAGADPAITDSHGKTALQYAINSGFNEMINLLLPISPK
ncbi:ankyrin repeat domain-containing protein [Sporomusa sphaeroides]|uniref:ankyrin repeat domain-containing protein n=1 Tax=Sporomusa sphaeroides TaxID=47679 RepID=UPI003DA15DE6